MNGVNVRTKSLLCYNKATAEKSMYDGEEEKKRNVMGGNSRYNILVGMLRENRYTMLGEA